MRTPTEVIADLTAALNEIPTQTECQCQGERSSCLSCRARWVIWRTMAVKNSLEWAQEEISGLVSEARCYESVPAWLARVKELVGEKQETP